MYLILTQAVNGSVIEDLRGIEIQDSEESEVILNFQF